MSNKSMDSVKIRIINEIRLIIENTIMENTTSYIQGFLPTHSNSAKTLVLADHVTLNKTPLLNGGGGV